MTVETIKEALARQAAEIEANPPPFRRPPMLRRTTSWGTDEEDTFAHVSLTTDDRSSGSTEYILTIDSFGSDCIEIVTSTTTKLVVKFQYGGEGGAIIEGLKQVLSAHK